MIGRAPFPASSVYPQAYSGTSYPGPAYGSQPAPWPGTTVAGGSGIPLAGQSVPPPPIVRAKGPDDSATAVPPVPPPRLPSRLTMPSPEQLGVASPRASASSTVDWAAAHRRLDGLHAVCFHLEKLPQGGFRFTCLLPTAQAGRTHRVDAVAATDAEVVSLALNKAEEWAAGSRQSP